MVYVISVELVDNLTVDCEQLAQVLMARLSYANLKVNQGWIQQNIDEVEHLYSSRFRGQAEQRRSRQSATIAGNAGGITVGGGKTRGSRALLPSLDEELPSTLPFQQLLSHPQPGTASRDAPPPRRPFADAMEDATTIAETAKAPATHYLGYTPTLYSGYDGATGLSYPRQEYSQLPQEGYHHHLQPHAHNPRADASNAPTSASPSLHQANHSMYTYLASPVVPNNSQFAASSHGSDGSSKAAVESASVALQAQQASWAPIDSSNAVHVTHAHPIAANTYTINAEYRDGITPIGYQTSLGPQYDATQMASRQYPMAPVPAITPRPDLSAATFTSVVSKPTRNTQHPHTRADSMRGHLRNPSLRGEYSVSNVTMDDLDSHFGQ